MDRDRDAELFARLEDPFVRRSLRAAMHMRRYMPFYVFGTIWVVILALFPSIQKDDDDNGLSASGGFQATTGGGTSNASTAAGGGGATGTDPNDPAAAGTNGAGGTGATGGATRNATTGGATGAAGAATGTAAGGDAEQAISAEQAQSAIQLGTGTTRLGAECKPGVRQVPNFTYAQQCQNKYDGPNGGETYRGVTAEKIKIVRRKFPSSPNQQAVDRVNESAGFASREVNEAIAHEWIKYFNQAYELYGRQVEYVNYESRYGGQTQSTDEAQGKGKENACLDADVIVKELKAFGIAGNTGGSAPFSECAADRGLFVFGAGAYYPEAWYRKTHPYNWHIITECERISYQLSEYVGKRLVNKPAKWAKDAVLKTKTRHFGTYVPDNDGYQFCVSIFKRELKSKYGLQDTGPQYNYQLDISRFPDQAAAATVQFKSAGVTTVVLACDYISTIVMTQAAKQQNWFPEWLNIGVALNDTDNAARLMDQDEVNGAYFGPSQLGSTNKLLGKQSEAGKLYKQAFNKEIAEGTTGDLYYLGLMYNLMQAAGPILNPQNLSAGVSTIIDSGPENGYPLGYGSLRFNPDGSPGIDHTLVDDAREVYYVSEPGTSTQQAAEDDYYNGPDGKNGTFKETYDGARFKNGEWPAEDPPIYPPR